MYSGLNKNLLIMRRAFLASSALVIGMASFGSSAKSQAVVTYEGNTYQLQVINGTTNQLKTYFNDADMPWWNANYTMAEFFAESSELNNVHFAYNCASFEPCGLYRTYRWDGTTSLHGHAQNASYDFAILAPQYSAISANEADIAANTAAIQNMSANQSNDTDIAANTTAIQSNDTDIAANTTAIQSNDTDIAANTTAIQSNDTDIAANTTAIQSNDTDIAANATAIRLNEAGIADIRSVVGSGSAKLTDSGVSVEGRDIISVGENEVISIGSNSVKFGNEDIGDQTMWAEDQSGVVDINIVKGTDLKINGVSVQGQINDNKSAIRKNKKAIDTNRNNINNLGDGIAASTALGAALSALPVTPDDAPFSCGVGSGAYSSRFAMGLGCVAKLNQRLSLNAGGSHVFGGSSNYGGGSLDSVAWRGGFVLKLGKLDSPVATNEQLQSKVKELEERNAAVEEQNKALMARLERLEAIALGQQPATTTASLQ